MVPNASVSVGGGEEGWGGGGWWAGVGIFMLEFRFQQPHRLASLLTGLAAWQELPKTLHDYCRDWEHFGYQSAQL